MNYCGKWRSVFSQYYFTEKHIGDLSSHTCFHSEYKQVDVNYVDEIVTGEGECNDGENNTVRNETPPNYHFPAYEITERKEDDRAYYISDEKSSSKKTYLPVLQTVLVELIHPIISVFFVTMVHSEV